MKYYVTRYALTRGIIEVEGHFEKNRQDELILITKDDRGITRAFWKDCCFSTKEEAVFSAEAKRTKKCEELHKKISKLMKIDFNK